VKIIQLFDFPIKNDYAEEFLVGCAAVTFDSVHSAEDCCKLFSQEIYKGRKLYARLVVSDILHDFESQQSHSDNNVLPEEAGKSIVPPAESEVVYDEATLKEVEDVEDFLNSLL
jgi:hypothetical protein